VSRSSFSNNNDKKRNEKKKKKEKVKSLEKKSDDVDKRGRLILKHILFHLFNNDPSIIFEACSVQDFMVRANASMLK
jgi:hypothetical protein